MKINQLINKNDLNKSPAKSGVYWLYKKLKSGWDVVYIGIGKNINRRLFQHKRDAIKDFDAFYYEEAIYSEARKREQVILKSYKDSTGRFPIYNRQT